MYSSLALIVHSFCLWRFSNINASVIQVHNMESTMQMTQNGVFIFRFLAIPGWITSSLQIDAQNIPQDSMHAYLSGDIVECMARSDNVLNTGFYFPVDRVSVDIFIEALSIVPHSAEAARLRTTKSKKGMARYWCMHHQPENSMSWRHLST